MPVRLEVRIPIFPLCSKIMNKLGDIQHLAKVMVSFEPIMDGIRPTLTTECFFRALVIFSHMIFAVFNYVTHLSFRISQNALKS